MKIMIHRMQESLLHSSIAPLVRTAGSAGSTLLPLATLLEANAYPYPTVVAKAALGFFLSWTEADRSEKKRRGERPMPFFELLQYSTRALELALLVSAVMQSYQKLSWKPLCPFALAIPLAITRFIECHPLCRALRIIYRDEVFESSQKYITGKVFFLDGALLYEKSNLSGKKCQTAIACAKIMGGEVLCIQARDASSQKKLYQALSSEDDGAFPNKLFVVNSVKIILTNATKSQDWKQALNDLIAKEDAV